MRFLAFPLLLVSVSLYGGSLYTTDPPFRTVAWADAGRAQERQASQGAQERRASRGAKARQASEGAQERRVSRGAQERRTSEGAEERRQGSATPR